MEILTTDRLILRPWQLSDSSDLYEYAQLDIVGPNAGWPPHQSEEESKEIIEMFINDNDVYAIVLQEEQKVIGSIGLHNRKPDAALATLEQREIGYILHPNYWGRGIVPEAVQAVLAYGFQQLGLDLVWCGHFESNDKSKRVVEKCQFQYRFRREETLRLLDNKKEMTLYYAITREDYMNR